MYLLCFSWGENSANILLLIYLLVQASAQFTSLKFCMTTAILKVTTILDIVLLPALQLRRREIQNLFPSTLILNNPISPDIGDRRTTLYVANNAKEQMCLLLGQALCTSVQQVFVILNSFFLGPWKKFAWRCFPSPI